MLTHLIDFFFDYFTNLNTRKIIGGLLMLIGLAVAQKILTAEDLSRGVLYLCVSVFIGGIGAAIIYHDIGLDKAGTAKNDLELIAKAYELKDGEDKVASGQQVEQSVDSPKRPHF